MNNNPIIAFILFLVVSINAQGLEKTKNDEDQIQIYSMVPEMPVFENNEFNNFESFIKSVLEYPLIAKQNEYYGTVTIEFIVYVDGVAKNATVLKGDYPSLSYEAIRAVNGTKG